MSQALDTPGVDHDIKAPEDEALRGSADQTNENNEQEETPPAPSAIAEAPPAPAGGSAFEELFGETLVGKEGSVATKDVLAGKKNVLLYFSAHWCPPCRGFTPQLAKTYKDSSVAGKDTAVLFISSDRDQASFDQYYAEMPWHALPFDKRDLKDKLSTKFEVNGIPMLVVLDDKGQLVTANGRAEYQKFLGGSAADPDPDPEAQPTIGTVATGSLVDGAVQQRNKTLRTMALQSSLGLVTMALDVVGVVSKADESCDKIVSPVPWSIWYTVHAVMVALMILCSLLLVYAVSLLANKDVLTSQVHAARGKQAEAAKDRQAALPKMQQGQRLFVKIGIFSCLMAVFSVVWLIIGIVVYTKSDINACDDSKQWFWVVLSAGLVMQAISSFMKPKKQQQE